MYKTKKEVDAHVRTALSKLRSESERQLRSFTIAKLYYKINEYASAEQYLCSYLNVKEDNDMAHKLLGQCYQRLKKPDKALQSFQRSLQLNAKQPDVLVEVCQLLLDDKNLNMNKAKYWCELAESEKVQHDAVFSLRLKLMNKDNLEVNQVEEMIQKEIVSRPNDVQLRVRLVRNYIDQKKITEAFKYVHNLEMTNNDNFSSSSEWYNIVWLVLSKYEQLPNSKKDWEFWLMLITCLERQVYISFSHSQSSTTGGVTETANLLFSLDQYLYKVSQISEKFCAQKELVSLFLEHYRGQLLLHAASLIFKRELLQNKNKWKETVQSVLPLLLLAYQSESVERKEPWMKHCDEQGKQLIQLWNRECSFRCAQVGRTLLSCIADETSDKENATLQINNMLGNQTNLWNSCDDLLAQIRQTCSDKQWRRQVFGLLFCNSDHKVKEQSSMLIKCPKLSEPQYELPTYADVERFEEAAQYLKPQSLQHIVYLCLGNDNLAFVRAKYFSGLNFSTQNLSFCGAESLNQLDMDTFLYAATIQAKRMLEVDREVFDNYHSGNRGAAGKPRILPFVNLQGHLCTEEQSNWWTAAYQVYKNLSRENLAELRANLQFGIEAVRGINGPKIDMIIVFKLGQIFVARAQDIVKPVEKAFLESRAENIYKYGLNMVKMNNKGVLEPFRKYFKYAKANSSAIEREVASAAEDAVAFLASRYFKKAEYEELIDELAGIQLPFATYLQAEAYRKMDEVNKTPKKAKQMYLDRASECLNQTLSLLKNTQTDPNHPLNSIIHSELKRVQQASTKFMSDSPHYSPITSGIHNNSSTYEDAETEFFSDTSVLPAVPSINRSRREAAAALIASPRNTDLENLVKQIATTLTFVKEEIVDTIKPEMLSMRKEITSLKDKIANLEDAMKKSKISSNPPSRDDASNVLDDLYMIEDALQNQLYQQPSQTHLQPHNNLYPSNAAPTSTTSYVQQPQQRIHTPNAMQIQQNAAAVAAAAAAYNSPLFNPNYQMNYYTPQYMMTPQGPGAGAVLGQRNPMGMPYMDAAGGMNFGMTPTTPLLPQPTADQQRAPTNLFGMLSQQTQQSQPTQPIQQSSSQIVPPVSIPITMPPVSTSRAPVVQFNKVLNNQPVEKGPPANVVITSSDPLPNPNCAPLQSQQPTLSVTIPSHHIKPSLVSSANEATTSSQQTSGFTSFSLSTSSTTTFGGFGSISSNSNTPASSSGTSFFTNKPSSVTSSIAVTAVSPSTFSFKPQIAQAAKSADESLNKTSDSVSSEHNKSGTADPEAEYDPRPDFKPIIPLPDEIEVKTGEEDEEVMFCHRAKLFRLIDKDWKERGIGDIKILKSKDGSSRILMRRDQTHKICANHKITKDIVLSTPKNETKGHIWIAHDYADEEIKYEKFFVRFKLPETAQQFSEAFKNAQKEAGPSSGKDMPPPAESKTVEKPVSNAPQFNLAKSSVTNFATSTPSVKPAGGHPSSAAPIASSTVSSTTASKTLFSGLNSGTSASNSAVSQTKQESVSPFAKFSFDKPTAVAKTTAPEVSTPSASPFSNIFSNLGKSQVSPFSTANLPSSFTTATKPSDGADSNLNKSNTSDAEEEYVPTAQFNPVIPLPDLIEVTTGEENEIVLFEHRAKLLRFDKEVGEWKERGLGNIKILQNKDDVNKVRLVMRREQIHKLCCNQRLYKDTTFKYAKNSETALTWAGQDFSENELVTEMLTVRFKTAEICKSFHDAIIKAQENMSSAAEEGNVKKQEAADKESKAKTKDSKDAPKGFGDAFKPKPGSWSCQACYTSNTSDKLYCLACENPKDDTVPKKEPASILNTSSTFSFKFGTNVDTNTSNSAKPAFGFSSKPANSTATSDSSSTKSTVNQQSSGFGDKFKPKAGSWTCEGCYVSNTSDAKYCMACDAPKDSSIPKKEPSNNILALSDPSQKFSFGFAAVGATKPVANSGFQFGTPATTTQSEPTKSSFGVLSSVTNSEAAKSFTFTPPSATSTGLNSSISKPTFSFSLPSKAMDAPAMPTSGGGESTFSLEKKEFSLSFKPKSPANIVKSPLKFGGGGDADGADDGEDGDHHVEEENNTYFTPVIPLPDKIEVKTGEEDEDVLYVHRAKLYRFVEGEWKERGLGDVKILRHKETKKLRVVMRREQILKICLNHVLNEDVEYKRKDDKSWLFVVNDFSEGEVELHKFSLRFKNKEIAEAFMDAIKSSLSGEAVAIDTTANTSTTAINISNADKKMADELQLPYEFFESKPSCPGCRGCNSDSFVFPTLKSNEFFVHEDDTKPPLSPMELPELTVSKHNRSFLKQSALASPVVPKVENKVNDSIFGGFSGANSTTTKDSTSANTTFSFTAAFNSTGQQDETKPFSGGFLFGNTIAANKPVFGQTSIFGGGIKLPNSASESLNSTEKSTSIFGGSAIGNAVTFGSKPSFDGSNSIFNATANKSDSTKVNETSKSIFGSSISTQSAGNGTGNSIFGSSTFSGFGTSNKSTIFGDSNTNTSLFGNVKKEPASEPLFVDLSKKAGDVDFANLAAKASNVPLKPTEKPGPGGFIGLTNTDAFSSFLKPTNNKNSEKSPEVSEKKAEEADNDENYDPHYDPIIALPNEIVVSTGEEEESKLFGERATLFRWDGTNKEWKERGVGELKILYHPTQETYRLLLRREQIHKLVLNFRVGNEFVIKNMNNNPKSFVFGGMNYAESTDGEVEELAVRFSKVEKAEAFGAKIKECIAAAKKQTGDE